MRNQPDLNNIHNTNFIQFSLVTLFISALFLMPNIASAADILVTQTTAFWGMVKDSFASIATIVMIGAALTFLKSPMAAIIMVIGLIGCGAFLFSADIIGLLAKG